MRQADSENSFFVAGKVRLSEVYFLSEGKPFSLRKENQFRRLFVDCGKPLVTDLLLRDIPVRGAGQYWNLDNIGISCQIHGLTDLFEFF